MPQSRVIIIVFFVCLVLSQSLFTTFTKAVDFEFDGDITLQYQWSRPFLSFEIAPKLDYKNGEITPDLQTMLTASYKTMEFGIGRKTITWGPGYYGQLLMDHSAPPVNHIYYSGVMNLPKSPAIQFTQFMAKLENENNRHYFGHSFLSEVGSGITVGFTENAILSGDFHPIFYNPIFFVPYYFLQHLSLKNNNQNNHLNVIIGINFEYKRDTERVYSELLIDDFPQSNGDRVPKNIGYQFGYERQNCYLGTTLHLEYVRVNNFVYAHREPLNQYTVDNKCLGHWMGNDGDVLIVGVEYPINQSSQLNIMYSSMRKGEGNFDEAWKKEYKDDYEFLTGVVERQKIVKVEYTTKVLQMQVVMGGSIGYTENMQHIQTSSGYEANLELQLKYFL